MIELRLRRFRKREGVRGTPAFGYVLSPAGIEAVPNPAAGEADEEAEDKAFVADRIDELARASEQQAEAAERLATLSNRLAHERDDAFPLFTERLAAIEEELEALAGDMREHSAEIASDTPGGAGKRAEPERDRAE